MTTISTSRTILVTRQLLGDLRTFVLWWLALVTIGLAAVGAGAFLLHLPGFAQYRFFDSVEASIWDVAPIGLRYLLFIMGLVIAAAMLPHYVGHGVTRRRFVIGELVAGIAVAVGVAAFLTVGYLIEAGVYAVAGMPQTLTFAHMFSQSAADRVAPGELFLLFIEFVLVFIAHYVTALLLVNGFQRFGCRAGSLFMVVALAPVLVTGMVLGADWLGIAVNAWFGLQPPSPVIGSVLALVAITAGMVVHHRLTRAMDLDPPG